MFRVVYYDVAGNCFEAKDMGKENAMGWLEELQNPFYMVTEIWVSKVKEDGSEALVDFWLKENWI